MALHLACRRTELCLVLCCSQQMVLLMCIMTPQPPVAPLQGKAQHIGVLGKRRQASLHAYMTLTAAQTPLQDDRALDRTWRKEAGEAGRNFAGPLYQLFRRRRGRCWLLLDVQGKF